MLLIDVTIIGAIPWAGDGGIIAQYEGGVTVMALFCTELVGQAFAQFFVVVVVVTIFGSCFSLVLGYAAIPYVAACRDAPLFIPRDPPTHCLWAGE